MPRIAPEPIGGVRANCDERKSSSDALESLDALQ